MTTVEGPVTSVPGISAIETLVTFFIIPTAMFVVISAVVWALSSPKKSSTSAVTSIE